MDSKFEVRVFGSDGLYVDGEELVVKQSLYDLAYLIEQCTSQFNSAEIDADTFEDELDSYYLSKHREQAKEEFTKPILEMVKKFERMVDRTFDRLEEECY